MTKQDALQRVRGFLATRFPKVLPPDWISGREQMLMAACDQCFDRRKDGITVYSLKGAPEIAELPLHIVLAQMLWETQVGGDSPRAGIFDDVRETMHRFHVAHGTLNALPLSSRTAPLVPVLSQAS